MSSPAPDAGVVVAARGATLRRVFGLLRNLFAVLGLVLITAVGWLYAEGLRSARELPPQIVAYLTRAGWTALDANVATAVSTRVQLEPGVSPDQAVAAMDTRAAELGLSMVEILAAPPSPAGDERAAQTVNRIADAEQPEQVPDDDGGAVPLIRVFAACPPQKVDLLTRYAPDLLPFMPCREALYRDAAGRGWLATVNL